MFEGHEIVTGAREAREAGLRASANGRRCCGIGRRGLILTPSVSLRLQRQESSEVQPTISQAVCETDVRSSDKEKQPSLRRWALFQEGRQFREQSAIHS